MKASQKVDFTTGPLLKKIILYALPIVGVNVLQILFTTADVAVLGIFTNDQAVASVGATTAIVNLLVGFFVGLSVASNVLVARCVGSKDSERAKRLVGTSVFISVIFGFILMVLGVVLAETILVWVNCDPLVLPYATTYLRIYFLGMPIIMLYNFGAAVLRAVGNTLKPLLFLVAGGIFNIILNIFFVVVVKIDVAGVAIATVASQAVSAGGGLYLMAKDDGYAKLDKKYLKIFKSELGSIMWIGLPLGLSKCLFSFSNVLIQSELNKLGDLVMASFSITKEFDNFILESTHGFAMASLAVISQNYGAKNSKRMLQTIFISMGVISTICIVLGGVMFVIGDVLCGIMTDTEEVLRYCRVRINTVSILYITLGMLQVVLESIRGIGYSFTAMILSVFANIILRIAYVLFIYPAVCVAGDTARNLTMLYLVYPVSWSTCAIAGGIILAVLYKKVKRKFNASEEKEIQTIEEKEREVC